MNKWDFTFSALLAIMFIGLVFKINVDNKNSDICVDSGGKWVKVAISKGSHKLKCEFKKPNQSSGSYTITD
jgi:hypothetical protein